MIPALETSAPSALRSLPLATLYLTERCNSRCVTCDYWRHGRVDMTLESVSRLAAGSRGAGHEGRADLGRRAAAQPAVGRRSPRSSRHRA